MSNVFEDSIEKFVDKNLIVAESNLTVTDTVKIMSESDADSVLVFENDEVIGIVTEKDVLRKVVEKGKDPTKVSIKEIASKPLLKVSIGQKVIEAIKMMNKYDVRRLVVTDGNRTIGMISQKKLVGNLGKTSAVLPELDLPSKIKCPYCPVLFDNKQSFTEHLSNTHVGSDII